MGRPEQISIAHLPRSLDDSYGIDLHEAVSESKPANLNRRAGRRIHTEIVSADVPMASKLFDVRSESRRFHDICECGTGRHEGVLDVLAHLSDLGAHVAFPDDLALAVSSELARNEYESPGTGGNHIRIEDA